MRVELLKAIQDIEAIDAIIARYEEQRKECEEVILSNLGVPSAMTQYTHHLEQYDVVINSPTYYKVNEEIYLKLKNKIKEKFNPVCEKIAYTVSVKLLKEAYKYAPEKQAELLKRVVSEKPGKVSISIKKPKGVIL